MLSESLDAHSVGMRLMDLNNINIAIK